MIISQLSRILHELGQVISNKRLQLVSGPILGLISRSIALSHCHDINVSNVIGLCVWMIIWWLTEVVRMGVTGLLPMIILPLMGIKEASDVSSIYFSDTVMVCWGSMLMTSAIEKYELHNLFADRCLKSRLSRLSPRWLLLGFIVSTGFMSMWMSNTATTALMCPLSRAVMWELQELEHANDHAMQRNVRLKNIATAVDIGIAFAATIGGMATLTGTGANLVLQGTMNEMFGANVGVSYLGWLMVAGPLSIFNLLLMWFILSTMYLSSDNSLVARIMRMLLLLEPGRIDLNSPSNDEAVCASELELPAILKRRGIRNVTQSPVAYSPVSATSDSRSSFSRPVEASEGQEVSDQLESSDGRDQLTTHPKIAVPKPPLHGGESRRLDFPSWIVILTFSTMAALWITRSLPGGWGWSALFSEPDFISDGTVAMGCCLFLLCCPSTPPAIFSLLWKLLNRARGLHGWNHPPSQVLNQSESGCMNRPGCGLIRGNELTMDMALVREGLSDLSTHSAHGAISETNGSGDEDSHAINGGAHSHQTDQNGKIQFILGWNAVHDVNWDIMFLLGGGFALSKGFQASGLSALLTKLIVSQRGMSLSSITIVCSLLAICVTNIMSNVATANIMLPAIACVGPSRGSQPLIMLAPVTMAISLALVLPIGTPPNAIILTNKTVTLKQLACSGFLCSVLMTLSILFYCYYVAPIIIGESTVPSTILTACGEDG